MSATRTTPEASHGAPFAAMMRGALLPSAVAGVLTALVFLVLDGVNAGLSAGLGLVVAVGFFSSGMALMSRLVRSASPHAFLAVALSVYLGQVIALLLFLMVFIDASWVDGKALGITALVVTIVWQGAAMLAFRRARILVYDEPTPGGPV